MKNLSGSKSMIEDKTHIEFAKLSDATEISIISKNDIEYGLGWKYTPERIARLIKDKTKNVIVVRTETELVGFGIMSYQEYQANLDLLGVKRNYRHMKIGTQIVQWLEKVAVTAGIFNIFVQVRASNTGAIGFYKNLGYSVFDEKKGYYRNIEAGILMVKNLRQMFNSH